MARIAWVFVVNAELFFMVTINAVIRHFLKAWAMGKRSNFERRDRDLYETPYSAVVPLLPFLPAKTRFAEPCAASGKLARHLESHGHNCVWKSDVHPLAGTVEKADALTLEAQLKNCEMIITNTPWKRPLLNKLIKHFRKYNKVWLLLDADYMHIDKFKPHKPFCSMIVSVGRVSWEENGISGKDNAAWYCFEKTAGQKCVFEVMPEKVKKRCPATKDLFTPPRRQCQETSARRPQISAPKIISLAVQ